MIALLGTFAIGPWGTVWLIGVALLVAVGAAYAVEVPVERLRKRLREARRLVAADRSARLCISGDRESLRIHAANRVDGRAGQGSGLGLIGMQERVAVLGGTLSHGSSAAGVFEVDATLPVGP